MLITMLTTGSRGDTQPYMALGWLSKREATAYGERPRRALATQSLPHIHVM